ncbi:hypothetical protein QQ045_009142 [Rhodiola kirilowii]
MPDDISSFNGLLRQFEFAQLAKSSIQMLNAAADDAIEHCTWSDVIYGLPTSLGLQDASKIYHSVHLLIVNTDLKSNKALAFGEHTYSVGLPAQLQIHHVETGNGSVGDDGEMEEWLRSFVQLPSILSNF